MEYPRKLCFFGTKCCRRNPLHFEQYAHSVLEKLAKSSPSDEEILIENEGNTPVELVREQLSIIRKKLSDENEDSGASPVKMAKRINRVLKSENISRIQKKIAHSEPFRFFLTKIKDMPLTHESEDSVFLAELIHPSLGKIKKTCQINFMVELDFLLMNYKLNQIEELPMLLIYGEEDFTLLQKNVPKNIRSIRVKPRFPFGTHHTKMMILVYDDDSLRIVILTANLVASDWQNRTQGLWISPRCFPKENAEDSPTKFKKNLLNYLKFYELSALQPYIQVISEADFSEVNVFFVGSVPGSHRGESLNEWGHRAVNQILKRHVSVKRDWPLIMQCSSIGSLGPAESSWLTSDLAKSLSSAKNATALPEIKLIYPSKSDVLQSHDGIFGGGCLPYSSRTHQKQTWIEKYLHLWRSKSRQRNAAMPHIKTYTRLSPSGDSLSYFLLTSANLSKAAWGSTNKAGDSLLIMSYEAGVLFIPELINGRTMFDETEMTRLLPYDIPLQKYQHSQDKVWFYDYLLS